MFSATVISRTGLRPGTRRRGLVPGRRSRARPPPQRLRSGARKPATILRIVGHCRSQTAPSSTIISSPGATENETFPHDRAAVIGEADLLEFQHGSSPNGDPPIRPGARPGVTVIE